MIERRHLLMLAGTAALVGRPARATPEALQSAILAFTGGRLPQTGRVTLDIATLIDNGNAVPVAVSVQSPMTAEDHVQRIALFTELNPQPDVAVFHLGPRNGRATVSTRMRLANSQTVVALAALSDGSMWQQRVDVVVAIAACIES